MRILASLALAVVAVQGAAAMEFAAYDCLRSALAGDPAQAMGVFTGEYPASARPLAADDCRGDWVVTLAADWLGESPVTVSLYSPEQELVMRSDDRVFAVECPRRWSVETPENVYTLVIADGARLVPVRFGFRITADERGVHAADDYATLPADAWDVVARESWQAQLAPGSRRLIIVNGNRFSSARQLDCTWCAMRNGRELATGVFELGDLSPQDEKMFAVPAEVYRTWRDEGGYVELALAFVRRGRPVGESRLAFPYRPARLRPVATDDDGCLPAPPTVKESARTFRFVTPGLDIEFAKETALPVAVRRPGRLWSTALSAGEWAPVAPLLGRMRPVAAEFTAITVTNAECRFSTRTEWRSALGAQVCSQGDWRVRADGLVIARLVFEPQDAAVAELGLGLAVPTAARALDAFAPAGGEVARMVTAADMEPLVAPYGLRADALAIRALGEPFARAELDAGRGELRVFPAAEFAFTLSVGDEELVSRTLPRKSEL